jgi:hypothetical protein
MDAGVVDLIKALRRRYPDHLIMVNGGLELADRLRGVAHRFAMESSLTSWDFEKKTARWRRPDERAWVRARVGRARAANEALKIYALDYWDPNDHAGIRRIYAEQRAAGYIPYVATIALDRVVPEPKPATAAEAPASPLTPAQGAAP